MDRLGYTYDLHSVFDDFLTLCICTMGMNPVTRLSYDEDLYLETISKYKGKDIVNVFPKLYAYLIMEMEARVDDSQGNDVIGEYYEQTISMQKHKGQFFTPWPLCVFMAECLASDSEVRSEPVRVLDPACGSGRMLLASARSNRKRTQTRHVYYGIDIDRRCVKMTAINLFLNGIFNGEVLCTDALNPVEFNGSYTMSFLPFGLFRIADKEQSALWKMMQYQKLQKATVKPICRSLITRSIRAKENN